MLGCLLCWTESLLEIPFIFILLILFLSFSILWLLVSLKDIYHGSGKCHPGVSKGNIFSLLMYSPVKVLI